MTSLFQLLMQKQTTLGNMTMLEPDCMRDHIKGQYRGMLTVHVFQRLISPIIVSLFSLYIRHQGRVHYSSIFTFFENAQPKIVNILYYTPRNPSLAQR